MHQPTKRLALATAAIGAGTLAHADPVPGNNTPSITSFDMSGEPLVATTANSFFVDFDTMTASSSEIANYDFTIEYALDGSSGPDTEKPQVVTKGGWNVVFAPTSKLMLGASFDSFDGTDMHFLENVNTGDWQAPDDGFGYLGFYNTISGAQAWASIDYNDDGDYISLLGAGYNSTGTILTGQVAVSAVPEPSTSAAIAAVLAGCAAVYKRRRKTA